MKILDPLRTHDCAGNAHSDCSQYFLFESKDFVHIVHMSLRCQWIIRHISFYVKSISDTTLKQIILHWGLKYLMFVVISKQIIHITFFWANHQQGASKFISWTQYDFSVNWCDWRILAGNKKRIGWYCLNRRCNFFSNDYFSSFCVTLGWHRKIAVISL